MSRAETLTKALGGLWSSGSGLACCPAHEDRAPSLSLREGESGKLLLNCFAGCAFAAVLAALKARGLISGEVRPDPQAQALRREQEARRREARSRCGDWAARIWGESLPISETQAEAYLRKRGALGPLSRNLRHHPRLKHPSGCFAPALLARIEGGEGFALHRTWLDPRGAPAKIGALPQKAMLGPARGGAVRLREGGSGLLAVAEGIETALALGRALEPEASLWAALSTSGMRSLRLPLQAGALLIGLDGDAPGRAAGAVLAHRAAGLGWRVRLADPGEGRDFADLAALADGGGHG
ncbi:toprim domain-containing protein [Neomegalonema sp.]|uniref:DUF7146 domain-containing protein n=1 Tax=Neomegalonema sp. TaxID=2039713 RepID=UPI00261036C8|nr:toprim domain-containing protein [Neomegalonema sp.]MDD2868642.1 toprim domain-containing protein [Neomegalonema sp.]